MGEELAEILTTSLNDALNQYFYPIVFGTLFFIAMSTISMKVIKLIIVKVCAKGISFTLGTSNQQRKLEKRLSKTIDVASAINDFTSSQ